jgi:uncharacterized protein involved in exopolysaccharide biosynthesis
MNESIAKSIEDDDNGISLLDLLQVVVDNLRLLVLGPVVAGLIALGYTFTIVPSFTATTTFMPPQRQQSGALSIFAGLGALGSLAGLARDITSPTDQYIAFLKSRTLRDALIDRLKMMERTKKQFREDARRAIDGSVQISAGKDGLITIKASDKDPIFAAELANAHTDEFGKLLNHLAISEAHQRRVFFERQLGNAKDDLIKSEQALKASGINRNVLKVDPSAAVEVLAKLKATITAQEIRLASMRGYMTESAAEFKQAQTELIALRSQVDQIEKVEPVSASGINSDYITKYREFKYHETLFDLFTKQYDVARIDESREGINIQIVDVALPPERKSSPKKAQIALITTLVTSFTLLIGIFIRQALYKAAKRPEVAYRFTRLSNALLNATGRTVRRGKNNGH